FDETLQQEDIGIQSEDPFGIRHRDGLVLGGGKADVFFVVDDSTAVLERLQNVDGAVARVVIDDDDLFKGVLLIEYGFEAALDEAPAVIRDDRYRDPSVPNHVAAVFSNDVVYFPVRRQTCTPSRPRPNKPLA